MSLDSRQETRGASLLALLAYLERQRYDFVTPMPSTVRRWTARGAPGPATLRDIFGWGFWFSEADLPRAVVEALDKAGVLERQGGRCRSLVRAARIQNHLFLHSAFPGAGDNAVFVGPDSYRFADFIRRWVARAPVTAILDVGTGAGVGAIIAAHHAPGAKARASDVNPAALALAGANAAFAGVDLDLHRQSGLENTPAGFDLILANPPYVAGQSGRVYKDGGGDFGERLALDWAREAIDRLAPGGRMLLYTGAPILAGGRDVVRAGLEALCAGGLNLTYEEIDPDIFAGELRRSPYENVERIAAIGAVIQVT